MEGLVNMMEETVLKKIDMLWETTDGCKCQKCKLDIAHMHLTDFHPDMFTHFRENLFTGLMHLRHNQMQR